MSSKVYFIGLDAGLGVKSATGIAVIDINTFRVVAHRAIWPQTKRNPEKFYEIAAEARDVAKPYLKDSVVSFESFVMAGKSGQSLQRLIGSIQAALSDSIGIMEVPNTAVKQIVSGSGKGDKEAVADGLLAYFKGKNRETYELVRALKKNNQHDVIDAIAIAVSGYLTSREQKGRRKVSGH